MLKATLVSLEQSFDPGFLVRADIGPDFAEFRIVRNSAIVEIPHIPQWECENLGRDASMLEFSRIRDAIRKIGEGYQVRIGWRDAVPA